MFKSSQPPTQKKEMALLPPPPPGMLNAMKKVSPPKPDTPPSPVSILYCLLDNESKTVVFSDY